MIEKEYQILDKGFIRLDGYYADDISVVNSARVSYGKRVTSVNESDKNLIRYLIENRHGTPFEHNFFRFHVKAPIFVAREWFRHRISSFNEMSMRYHSPELEFYLPETLRTQVGKPGAYTFEDIDSDSHYVDQSRSLMNDHFEYSKNLYEHFVKTGLAKELSRIVVPVSAYTEFYWSVNARSLMNFISLRNSPHAQHEIREYAIVVEEMFKVAMPITAKAWIDNERVAP